MQYLADKHHDGWDERRWDVSDYYCDYYIDDYSEEPSWDYGGKLTLKH